jgi:cytochrome c oxidase subunit 2
MIKNFFTFCDAPQAWQFGVQDPATPNLEGMISFHNYLCIIILSIVVFVCWLLVKIVTSFNNETNKNVIVFTHSSILEIIWTIIPALILLAIAVPSFALLYSIDELIDPTVTLKVIGHQWYWSYEYSDFVTLTGRESLNFDSYMVSSQDLTIGTYRLLEVDNKVILPINTHIRVLITAADVLHSWAIPSFGLKVDACPGRLTQASLYIKREGLFFGQCSEICGINHGFMPIVVKGVSTENFINWIAAKI